MNERLSDADVKSWKMVFSPLKRIYSYLVPSNSHQGRKRRKTDEEEAVIFEEEDFHHQIKKQKIDLEVNNTTPDIEMSWPPPCRQCQAGLPGHISHILS